MGLPTKFCLILLALFSVPSYALTQQELNTKICQYVPSVAQTNSYNNGGVYNGRLVLSGNAQNVIQVPKDGQKLSFDSNSGNFQCDYPTDPKQTCLIDNTITYPGFPFNVPAFPASGSDFECKSTNCSLSSGTYKDVKITKNNATLTLNSGVYYFNELNFDANGAKLEVTGPVEIHFNKIFFKQNGIVVNSNNPANQVLFIGHGEDSFVKVEKNSATIKAYFYISHEATSEGGFGVLSNNNSFTGGITAYNIEVSGNNNTFSHFSGFSCDSSNSPVASLVVEPNNFHLTCQDNTQLYVVPYDSNGNRLFDVDGENVTLSEVSTNKLTVTSNGFNASEGRYEFTLGDKSDNQYEAIRIKASLDSDNSVSATSDLMYVPFKFEVNNGNAISLVAGLQDTNISVKTLACDSAGKPISINYNKTFTESDINVSSFSPASGTYIGKLSFSAPITNGEAAATMRFDETGTLTGEFSDNISCDDLGGGLQGCPSGGSQDIVGTFTIQSRPWAFAVCTSADTSGTSSSGPAFVAAGGEFDVQVYPIGYQSGVTIDSSGRLVSDDVVCSVPPLSNPSISNSPSYTVSLSHELDSPLGGSLGVITSDDSLQRTNTVVNPELKHELTKLKWSEVGSISLIANTSSSGYSGSIIAGLRKVGRFYPDFFKIDENAWNDPLVGGGPQKQAFTYMNQAFSSVTAKVGAYNVQGTATTNYGAFSSSLQAVFQFDNRDRLTNADTASLATKSSYQSSQWVLSSDQIAWSKNADFTPDGPYNYLSGSTLNVNLEVSPSTVNDPVRFKLSASDTNPSSTQALPDEQPRLLFGRYNLADVGGVQGESITVPLQAQYWNGSSFQTNVNDSFSTFDGTHHCSNVIWPSVGATNGNVTLNENGTLSSGDSRTLVARQTTSAREQVQLWLRLDNSSPSANCSGTNNGQTWMMYDWNQNGTDEENPSTVVTFGIFRGNDRVIFRGESGLTGQ